MNSFTSSAPSGLPQSAQGRLRVRLREGGGGGLCRLQLNVQRHTCRNTLMLSTLCTQTETNSNGSTNVDALFNNIHSNTATQRSCVAHTYRDAVTCMQGKHHTKLTACQRGVLHQSGQICILLWWAVTPAWCMCPAWCVCPGHKIPVHFCGLGGREGGGDCADCSSMCRGTHAETL